MAYSIDDFIPLVRKVVSWKKWYFAPHEKDDVIQEILIALPKALENYEGKAKIENYVKKVSTLRCLDFLRKKLRHPEFTELVVEPEDPALTPIERLMKKERIRVVREVVAQLSETCQDALALRFFEEKKFKEIAEQLDIEIGTALGRVHKCLKKFHEKVKQHPFFRE